MDTPGIRAAPRNEPSCATYLRREFTWAHTTVPTATGTTVTFDVPAGLYTHVILCGTPIGNTMVGWARILPVAMSLPGKISVTPYIHGPDFRVGVGACTSLRTWEETWTDYCAAMLEGDPTTADTLLKELTDR